MMPKTFLTNWRQYTAKRQEEARLAYEVCDLENKLEDQIDNMAARDLAATYHALLEIVERVGESFQKAKLGSKTRDLLEEKLKDQQRLLAFCIKRICYQIRLLQSKPDYLAEINPDYLKKNPKVLEDWLKQNAR